MRRSRKKKRPPKRRRKRMNRPDWDTYFMRIAHEIKSRSNCMRRQVGALIVRDMNILSTGYNGTPRGVINCCDGGCPRCNSDAPSGMDLSECLCAHAEENAIVQAARNGVCINEGTLYTTLFPCRQCAKMIINAGIDRVVYPPEEYGDHCNTVIQLLHSVDITMVGKP
jgi:dCMP deaminase